MFLVTSDNSTLGLTDEKSHVMRLTPDDLRCHLNTEQGPPGLIRVTTSEVRAHTSLHHYTITIGTRGLVHVGKQWQCQRLENIT